MNDPTRSSQNPSASDWAGARGDKWLAQLAGMEATLAPIDEPLLAALALDRPLAIAEVGSGGGATSLAIVRRAPAGSVVHGFDVSAKLVELARTRTAGTEALRFDVADMATTAPPRPYERLTSRFGVMFFDDDEAAFANLARWLAPGGRFAFAVWAPANENAWMKTVRDVVASVIEVPAPLPDAPGPFRYGNADKLLGILARAGFSALAVNNFRGALPIGGGLAPEAAADFALASFAAFADLLAAAGTEAQQRTRSALSRVFAEHVRDGSTWLEACVHIVTGTRV